MPFTTSLTRQILDHVFMGASLSQFANLWVGLSTTTPTASGGNVTEPAGAAYGRVSTAGADWDPAAAGSPSTVANGTQITFPTPTGSWGTVTNFTIHDAASGGNVVAFGALLQVKAISNGNDVNFPPGNLVLELGAKGDTYTGN